MRIDSTVLDENAAAMKGNIYFKGNLIILSILLFAVSCGPDGSRRNDAHSGRSSQQNLNINGANALYPLVQLWSDAYRTGNHEIRITVFPASSTKGITDVRLGLCDIGMVSHLPSDLDPDSLMIIKVARDAVLPTIHDFVPGLDSLIKKGLTRETLREIFTGAGAADWSELTGDAESERVRVFIRSDASGASSIWASYLGLPPEQLAGTGVYGDAGMTLAIRTNPGAIGYDNLRYIFDPATGKPYAGLRVLPIDFNSNGFIDPDEDVLNDLSELRKVISDSTLNFPLSRDLYLVTRTDGIHPGALEFLNWVLDEGQSLVPAAGYTGLKPAEVAAQQALLNSVFNPKDI
jgi:phosphate transport system substrate-binding protein